MPINLNSRMKSFDLTLRDANFIAEQVNFQPLDALGNPISPGLDASGAPLPGSISVDPATGAITFTVTLPNGSTTTYTYSDAVDPHGLRNVSGLFNNVDTGQQHFGQATYDFLRTLPDGYGGYLGQYLPSAGEADSTQHPFASALDSSLHHFGTTAISSQPNYTITQGAGGSVVMNNIVDYTPRMISQTVSSQAALDATGVATDVDSYNSTPFVRNQNTSAGDPSYSGWFVLFGQFFDHGLDFIDKGGNTNPSTGKGYSVTIPLATDDPLYASAPGHAMSLARATVDGFDANGDPTYANHTSPFIDQSQTYGSDPAITTLLREWVEDPNHPGTYIPGMRLFDGHSLQKDWTRWDGVATDQTLPTLAELRLEVHHTLNASLGRTDLTYTDVNNYHGTGQALVLDNLPVADLIDTTSDLNVFGDGPNLLKGVDLNSLLIIVPEDPSNPASRKLVVGIMPGADQALVGEAMMQALGDHYVAGDGRVNENFGLTSIHHVFHEEHNFQIDNFTSTMEAALADGSYTAAQIHQFQTPVNLGAGVLTDSLGNYVDSHGNISWDQNKMFEAAKLMNEMEYQHVAVDQYARSVTPDLPDFEAYNATKDASISMEYSQAAFRFGHSQLRETIDTIDPAGGITGQVLKYALAEAFLSPEKFAEAGPAAIALGMSHQLGNETDEFVTPALQQSLLGQPMDLAAINIARGRDVGLPTLNEARAALYVWSQTSDYPISGDLTPYASWNDFAANMIHPESLVNFIAAYSFDGDVTAATAAMGDSAFMSGGDQGFQKIDLWIGGLAEQHVDGGILGPTFNAIFVDQLERLMDGDRFYYIGRLDSALPQTTNLGNQLFTDQFKDIIERTTGATHLTGDVFMHADSYLELGDTPSAAELANRNTASDAHKYGDLAAAQHLGVFSDNGADTSIDGSIVSVGGKSYIADVRPDGALNPDGVSPSSGFNSHEVIGGTVYDDMIQGGGGFDTLYGDDGNDSLSGGDGDDHVYGGRGNDTIDGGAGEDLIDGEDGDDVLYAGVGTTDTDVMLGGLGNDKLYGGDVHDEMFGNAGNDTIDGGGGDDLIYGGEGTDWLIGGAGPDVIDGGEGDDTAAYSGNKANYDISFDAGTGRFTITDNRAGSPDDSDNLIDVEHFAFADGVVNASSYMPSVFSIAALSASKAEGHSGSTPFTFQVTRSGGEALAGSVAFTLSGVANAADFAGGVLPSGTVTFAAGETIKTLTISVAGDTVKEADEAFTVQLVAGASGSLDAAYGSAGGTIKNDDGTYYALGSGADKISYQTVKTSVQVNAGGGNDTITGSNFDDSLNGAGGNDGLSGMSGKDSLTGGPGADRLNGGAGNDTFLFGAGDLVASFAQNNGFSGAVDQIIDFHGAGAPVNAPGEQDYLRFSGFGAGAKLVFDHFGGSDHHLQYYKIVSLTDPSKSGYLMLQMSDTTNTLVAGQDYGFY